MTRRVAAVFGYAAFATLFTLIFYLAVPGPDGFGGPLIVSVCQPRPLGGFLGGMGTGPLFGRCETSVIGLILDIVMPLLIFLVIARVLGPSAGTTAAFGALLAVLALAYLAAGTTGDRLVGWTGSLVIGAFVGLTYASVRRPAELRVAPVRLIRAPHVLLALVAALAFQITTNLVTALLDVHGIYGSPLASGSISFGFLSAGSFDPLSYALDVLLTAACVVPAARSGPRSLGLAIVVTVVSYTGLTALTAGNSGFDPGSVRMGSWLLSMLIGLVPALTWQRWRI